MAHLTLRIGSRLANGEVPLTLTTPAGGAAEGRLLVAQFVGDFETDAVQAALNNTQNRRRADALGKGLFERLFPAGSDIRLAWDGLSKDERLLPLELVIEDEGLRAYPWEFLLDASRRGPGTTRRQLSTVKDAATAEFHGHS